MKKVIKFVKNNILAIILIVLLNILVIITTYNYNNNYSNKEYEIEVAKHNICAHYDFDKPHWLSIEPYEGREDTYIFTCIVDETSLSQYSFIVQIKNNDGEIDVDTWQIHYK